MKRLLWVLVLLAAGCGGEAMRINDHQFMDSRGAVVTVSDEYDFAEDYDSDDAFGLSRLPSFKKKKGEPRKIGSLFVAKSELGRPCEKMVFVQEASVGSNQKLLIYDNNHLMLDEKEFSYINDWHDFGQTLFTYLGKYGCNFYGDYNFIAAYERISNRRALLIQLFTHQQKEATTRPTADELKAELAKAIVSVSEPE